jgi:opacity protein-like surface antigen
LKRFITIVCALAITLSVAGELHAEADIGVKGVGARIGFVSPDGPDSAIGFGVLVDLGQFTPEIGFQATGDYWSKSEDLGLVEWSYSVMSFGARGIYEFATSNDKFSPYAGAGLAFHRRTIDVETPTVNVGGFIVGGSGDISDTEIGLDLVGGAGFAATDKMDIVGEARYRTGADQFDISAIFLFWFGESAE